ncbi:MAG: DUF7344 domain-containing protein [Natronomonas sp.]
MNSTPSKLSRDDLFEILSSDRRRRLVFYLQDQNGDADLSELARRIAAWENDIELSEVSERERKRVYISLYQTHVPKLEEYGLITYDSDRTRVFSTDRLDDVSRLVSRPNDSTGSSHPWQLYYPGLAAVSMVLLALLPLGFPYVTPTAVTIFVVGSLVVVSVAHYFVERSTGPTHSFSDWP